MGMTAYEHLCQKNGTTIALLFKSQACSHKKQKCFASNDANVCGTNDAILIDEILKNKPCCEDKSHYIKLYTYAPEITKVINAEAQPTFDKPHYLYSYNLVDIDSGNEKILKFYLYRPPPLPMGDLRVLYQTFLC